MVTMNLPKGGNKINSSFGMSHVVINGLCVHTFKIRVRKSSIAHQALWYVLKYETDIILPHVKTMSKKGIEYAIYSTATTDAALANKIKSAIDKASAYVNLYNADHKLGSKYAPDFENAYYAEVFGWCQAVSESDDLPF